MACLCKGTMVGPTTTRTKAVVLLYPSEDNTNTINNMAPRKKKTPITQSKKGKQGNVEKGKEPEQNKTKQNKTKQNKPKVDEQWEELINSHLAQPEEDSDEMEEENEEEKKPKAKGTWDSC